VENAPSAHIAAPMFSTPGLMQLRACRNERVPGLGWRVDFRHLPAWAVLPLFAGIFLIILSADRLTSLDWRGDVLALGCFAVSWLAQSSLVRAHNRRVAEGADPAPEHCARTARFPVGKAPWAHIAGLACRQEREADISAEEPEPFSRGPRRRLPHDRPGT
jgi:hypothetical protein